jgi:hypothetical protein
MPLVKFTRNLQRFFPDLKPLQVEGRTAAEVMTALERACPGLTAYFVDDQGALREHVNLFIGEELLSDRQRLTDPVEENQPIYIMQALSGG